MKNQGQKSLWNVPLNKKKRNSKTVLRDYLLLDQQRDAAMVFWAYVFYLLEARDRPL
jgi:hypothetical protein